jgi:hypothetical protein
LGFLEVSGFDGVEELGEGCSGSCVETAATFGFAVHVLPVSGVVLVGCSDFGWVVFGSEFVWGSFASGFDADVGVCWSCWDDVDDDELGSSEVNDIEFLECEGSGSVHGFLRGLVLSVEMLQPLELD